MANSSIIDAGEYYRLELNILCMTKFVKLPVTVLGAAIWVKCV